MVFLFFSNDIEALKPHLESPCAFGRPILLLVLELFQNFSFFFFLFPPKARFLVALCWVRNKLKQSLGGKNKSESEATALPSLAAWSDICLLFKVRDMGDISLLGESLLPETRFIRC